MGTSSPRCPLSLASVMLFIFLMGGYERQAGPLAMETGLGF